MNDRCFFGRAERERGGGGGGGVLARYVIFLILGISFFGVILCPSIAAVFVIVIIVNKNNRPENWPDK